MKEEAPPEGVRPLDHTADVGIEVVAPDLVELFRRAALGALWMALGHVPSSGREIRDLELAAEDRPGLMRSWIREILYWQEVEGFAASSVEIAELNGSRIVAHVSGGEAPSHPEREMKGVTWHGLMVEPRNDHWVARVIFDV